MTVLLTWIGQAGFLFRLVPRVHPNGRVAVLSRMADTPLHTLLVPAGGQDDLDPAR
jgi:hypothetical protein